MQSSNKKSVKWGILGTGSVANQFAEGLTYVSGASLHAVAGRNYQNTIKFANKHKVKHSYQTIEELLDSSIDIVYIATPNHLHQQQCILALNKKVPVLCEKPLATNASAVREIMQAATDNSVFCMEAMWMRFIPAIQEIKKLIDDGAIGKPILMNASFGIAFDEAIKSKYEKGMGGGALLDLGIYPISLACYLFGYPERVKSEVINSPSGVDGTSALILRHQNNIASSIFTSISTYTDAAVTIMGERGVIEVNSPIYRPYAIKVKKFEKTRLSDANAPYTVKDTIKSTIKKSEILQAIAFKMMQCIATFSRLRGGDIIKFSGNGYNYEAEEVMECLAQGKLESSVMPLNASLEASKIIDKILLDSETCTNGKSSL